MLDRGVDTRTENKPKAAVAEMMRRRIGFVIDHRLSAIQDADVIVPITDGRVVDAGSPRRVDGGRGLRHDLSMSQLRGDATPAAGA